MGELLCTAESMSEMARGLMLPSVAYPGHARTGEVMVGAGHGQFRGGLEKNQVGSGAG